MSFGLALAGLNLASNLISGSKARGAQRDELAAAEAERLQRKRLADVRAARERRNVIRESRIAKAQVVAAGVKSGAGAGSSGPAGGAASVVSQLGANLSFLDTVRDVEGQIGIFQSQGVSARQAGQKATAFGQLGNTIFGSGGLAERIHNA